MNDRRIWLVAGVIFLAAAALNLVNGSTVTGVLMAVAGVLALLTPHWQRRRDGRRRRP